MEENAILNPFNEVDIAAFHYCSIPMINEKLEAWHMLGQNIVSKQLKAHLYISGLQVQ